jgi:hypothetical protein
VRPMRMTSSGKTTHCSSDMAMEREIGEGEEERCGGVEDELVASSTALALGGRRRRSARNHLPIRLRYQESVLAMGPLGLLDSQSSQAARM